MGQVATRERSAGAASTGQAQTDRTERASECSDWESDKATREAALGRQGRADGAEWKHKQDSRHKVQKEVREHHRMESIGQTQRQRQRRPLDRFPRVTPKEVRVDRSRQSLNWHPPIVFLFFPTPRIQFGFIDGSALRLATASSFSELKSFHAFASGDFSDRPKSRSRRISKGSVWRTNRPQL